jgi:CheY-like chemotaxis protein
MGFFEDKNVLIVDDDECLRETVEKMLIEHFDQVFQACDGVEAIEVIEGEHIDVLVTDIGMPRMDGFELLGKIRWNHTDLPIVVMSGNTQAIKKSDEIRYQGYCFVQKPFVRHEMYYAIEQAYRAIVAPESKKRVHIPGTRNFGDLSDPRVVYKNKDEWLEAYVMLIYFRKKNPTKWPMVEEEFRSYKLGYWVREQRNEYVKFCAGEESKLTQDRVDFLNEIGFVWVGKDAKWLSRIDELKQYRSNNPDRWPQCVGKEKDLGKWCAAQRAEYRKKMNAEPTTMDDQRTLVLEAIGFKWDSSGGSK